MNEAIKELDRLNDIRRSLNKEDRTQYDVACRILYRLRIYMFRRES